MNLTRKTANPTLFVCTVIAISAPMVGAAMASGWILPLSFLPSWVFGAVVGFLASAGVFFRLSNARNQLEIEDTAPYYLILLILGSFGIATMHLSAGVLPDVDSGDDQFSRFANSVGWFFLWLSILVVPAILWLQCLLGLVDSTKRK